MSAGPGTPLAEIDAALSAANQQLAFEPPDLGPLLGGEAGQATIGGVFACNLAGPRRIKAGAARDHLLGLHAVSGRGESFKTGGRVVKNVTGYDVCKLMTGSFGTLGAFTDLTFKVLPAPEAEATLVLSGLADEVAIAALTAALQSPYDVSGAAHLPPAPASETVLSADGGAVTAVRLEGFAASVAARSESLSAALARFGPIRGIDGEESQALWRQIRDVTPFADDTSADRDIWKLSVPPAAGPGVAAEIGRATAADCYFDWGGGLIWLAIPASDDSARTGDAVRSAIADCGGHATLIRASEATRAAIDVFQPQPAPLAALTARVKDSFDPNRILNPGRMYAGV